VDKEESDGSSSFKEEMDSNLFYAQHVLSTGLNPTMENGFKFLKIRGEERMWILFSLSIVKVLNGFLLN
jgi:ketol-acid reductoisomerase